MNALGLILSLTDLSVFITGKTQRTIASDSLIDTSNPLFAYFLSYELIQLLFDSLIDCCFDD